MCVCAVRIRKQSVQKLCGHLTVEYPPKDILFSFLISEQRSGVAKMMKYSIVFVVALFGAGM